MSSRPGPLPRSRTALPMTRYGYEYSVENVLGKFYKELAAADDELDLYGEDDEDDDEVGGAAGSDGRRTDDERVCDQIIKSKDYPLHSYDTWPARYKTRIMQISAEPDYVGIFTFSKSLRAAAAFASDQHWKALVDAFRRELSSMHYFAIFYKVPVEENVRSLQQVPSAAALRLQTVAHLRSLWGEHHPHELYISAQGAIVRCQFYGGPSPPTNMVQIPLNDSELVDNFANWQPSAGGPYPPEWGPKHKLPYSQFWRARDKPYQPKDRNRRSLRCSICKKVSDRRPTPRDVVVAEDDVCMCDPDVVLPRRGNFLMQVYEVQLPQSPNSYPERGLRALEPIEKNAIIGEYIGRMIPYATQNDAAYQDNIYAHHFNAKEAPADDPNSGRRPSRQEELIPVSTVIAGERGNWIRFINGVVRPEEPNVYVSQEVIAFKNRLVVRAARDIAFGDELRMDYGDQYFLANPGAGDEEVTTTVTTGGGFSDQSGGDVDF